MDKRRREIEVVDGDIALTAEEIFLVMKALDVYAYALMASNSAYELELIQRVANKFVRNAPKVELDS